MVKIIKMKQKKNVLSNKTEIPIILYGVLLLLQVFNNILNNKIDRAMVESINNVGHVIGLRTIAEFAENQDIIDVLKEIGVDYAQGYGVAMPELFE